ncbi:hypothetical protein OH77DRAFT_1521744 [Trametes cingulata]|nr:hypothetical protein OH77DRAFT_1521744 [Trametes cingulata]
MRRLPGQEAHIDRLSDDVLLEILEHINEEVFRKLRTAVQEWMRLAQISQRWRAMVFSVSKFWRIIPVGHRPESLTFFLSRVKGSRTALDIFFMTSKFPGHRVCMLRPFSPSLPLLSFEFLADDLDEAEWADPLASLMSSRMPRLELLHIHFPGDPDNPVETLDLGLDWLRSPSLHTLGLTGLRVPTRIAHLRNLYISHGRWDVSWSQLLDTLEHNPELEELKIEHYFRWSVPNDFPDSQHRPVIRLGRLQELEIQGVNSNETALILGHLDLPNVKHLRLVGDLDRLADLEVPLIAIRSLFPREWQAIRRVVPRLTKPAQVMLHNCFDDYSVQCITEDEEILWSLSSYYIDWHPNLEDLILDFIHIFGQQKVRIDLSIHATRLPAVHDDVWHQLFRSLNLCKLTLTRYTGSLCDLWTGLCRAAELSSSTHGIRQQLSMVSITHWPWYATRGSTARDQYSVDLTDMEEGLRILADHGTRLEELNWTIVGGRGILKPSFREEATARLGAYVAKVCVDAQHTPPNLEGYY